MITSTALLLLPSWRALSRVQRRFVWQASVHPQLIRWPVILAKMVLGFLFIFVAYRFGALSSFVPSLITIFFIVVVIPELMDLCLLARHRRDIEAYIQGHGSEIQSMV